MSIAVRRLKINNFIYKIDSFSHFVAKSKKEYVLNEHKQCYSV